ncbi:hypothetical protein AaE_012073 [Aphanomyces astaci]|uniref:Uncharacterized protein n=1 Tax=Aphanomyces astaci TaxID=112090 RepID=A0A6A4ZKZ9_APHAT|nr:hypothetical protein AaE_012073 [Aphanomyces astaci]
MVSHDEYTQIAKAMEQIKNGTFDPDNCDIPGYLTPEQEEREALAAKKREDERVQREQARKQKEKQDEHDHWWHRAKLRFATYDDDDDTNSTDPDKWANRIVEAYKARDGM